jgi:hypothetical protein
MGSYMIYTPNKTMGGVKIESFANELGRDGVNGELATGRHLDSSSRSAYGDRAPGYFRVVGILPQGVEIGGMLLQERTTCHRESMLSPPSEC